MTRFRKYAKLFLVLLALFVAAQVAASLLVRTKRARNYMIAQLERAFGRRVEAGQFSAQIFPVPQLDVDGVTIGEDPAFGNEYFLRAEHMAVSLRWTGLFRGKFEFGNIALSRPSLILVRNAQDVWNLEGWLPSSGARNSSHATAYGPQLPPATTHHLQKIEFDEGRVNFKYGDQKRPVAFSNVL